MRNKRFWLPALLLGVMATASADETVEGGKKKVDPNTAQAREKLRAKAVANVERIVDDLDLGASKNAKAKALLSESQWEQAVKAFKTSRGDVIHEHAHAIVPATIPGLMRKFMPGYMRSKIMASRRKGRRGPPSRDEIAKIQKEARAKIQPVMRKTVMAALDELKQTRIDQLLRDEKTMTRVLADRIIRTEVLGKAETKRFREAVEKAGYPASLTTGADPIMNERTKKMLGSLDLEQIVKAAGL